VIIRGATYHLAAEVDEVRRSCGLEETAATRDGRDARRPRRGTRRDARREREQ
jgi:hypothetical protein